jgi:hypothetical protein
VNEHPSIIRTGDVTTLHADEPWQVRTVEIVTDGRVGSQEDATHRAYQILGPDASLSFRKSKDGELRFYFTDRLVDMDH